MARLPGAEAVTPLVEADFHHDAQPLSVYGVDPAPYARWRPDRPGRVLDRLDEGIAVTTEMAAAHGWHVGSRVSGTLGRRAAPGP
ncbi:hypothetical protein NKH77_01225 [Streptomyces sp. M19]